jgi:protein phosphatase
MSNPDFYARSERGLRTRNDDAYCAERIGDYLVFAIAEGLAGHPYGDIASMAAIESLKGTVKSTSGSPQDILTTAIRNADAEIRALSRRSPKHAGLATRLVACIIDKKMGCTVIDIGGENCYVITENSIENALDTARARHLSGSRPLPHPTNQPPSLSDMISHALGEPYRLRDTDFSKFTLGNEFLLLSSDGLTDVLGKEGIAEIVRKNEGNIDITCEVLVQEAMNNGSDSTITVVLIHGKE